MNNVSYSENYLIIVLWSSNRPVLLVHFTQYSNHHKLRLYFVFPSKYQLNYILTKSKPNLPSSFLSCWAVNSSNVTHCGWTLLCCFDFTGLRLGEDGDPSPERQLVHNYLLRGAEDVVSSYKTSWINLQCYESHVWGNKWVIDSWGIFKL